MKRLFLIIVVTLMAIILFIACKKNNDTVTITTDRDVYIVTMSSARGFKLTPDFKSKKKYNKLEYHWITAEGEFINDFTKLGKDVKNQGETVLWGSYENDKVAVGTFDIKLEVIDSESQKILANTKLTIISDNGLYKIKK